MLRRRLQQEGRWPGRAGSQTGEGGARLSGGARRRRAGANVQLAAAALPLPVVAPMQAECAALLRTLIKHLLFQRSQIPYLYDQLLLAARQHEEAAAEAAAVAGGRRRRIAKTDRKLLKFLEKTEEALAALDGALASLGVPRRCLLLLGSSTSKPREVYEVLLPPASVGRTPASEAAEAATAAAGMVAGVGSATQPPPAGPVAEPAAPPQQAHGARPRLSRLERLCNHALRQLVMASTELPEGNAHLVSCKLFILLEGSSSVNEGALVSVPAEQQQLAAPRGFAVKRAYKLSMRRGVHITLRLGQHPQDTPDEQQAVQGDAADGLGIQDGSGMDCSQGGDAPTIHLSQLPDACAAPQPALAAPAEMPVAAVAAAAAAAAAAPTPVWYLCKAVAKGLNSGSKEEHEG